MFRCRHSFFSGTRQLSRRHGRKRPRIRPHQARCRRALRRRVLQSPLRCRRHQSRRPGEYELRSIRRSRKGQVALYSPASRRPFSPRLRCMFAPLYLFVRRRFERDLRRRSRHRRRSRLGILRRPLWPSNMAGRRFSFRPARRSRARRLAQRPRRKKYPKRDRPPRCRASLERQAFLSVGKDDLGALVMFLCVSPNPAIDKRMTLPALSPGEIHRAQTVQAFPGGKSAHVAMVLKALGAEPLWIGPCGGATGAELLAGLKNLGIKAHSVTALGETRTNLEIIDDAGVVTEIREPGSPISAAELSAFERACNELFEKGKESTTVIFSGSLPVGAPNNFYAKLIVAARAAGCRTFLDTSGEPLKLALAAHPDFVKPNRDEAATVLDLKITSRESTANALSQFLSHGACSAAISLGRDGMVYAPGRNVPRFIAPAVSLTPRSTVGCGDAALAGFAFALSTGASAENALRNAAACAAANCLADSPGVIDKDVVDKFQSQIRVETFILGP